MKGSDRRSEKAKEYRRLYNSAAWRNRRAEQLTMEPLCRKCSRQGIVTAATIADHMVPHRGNHDLFYSGELQSLCGTCHSGAKQREEKGGYSGDCDLDGYPIDPNHPQNRRG